MPDAEKYERKDERVSLSLPPDVAEQVRRIARRQATPVSSLIRQWVVERLHQLGWERTDD